MSLRVIAGACTSAVHQRTISVRLRPTVQLSSPSASYCTGQAATVNYSGTGPSGTIYTWDFDGGIASPGFGPQSQSVVWNVPGLKTVTLTAVAEGCTAIAQLSTTVFATPTAEFSLSRVSLCVQESLIATFTGVLGTHYFWDFDGGIAVPGTGAGPHTVRWSTPGAKTVRLYVVSGGCTSSVVSRNLVVHPVPTADFSVAQTQLCAGETTSVGFEGNAGANAEFFWDFDGGTAVPGAGRGPHVVSWNQAGTKNLRLRVVENGCTSQTAVRIVRVNAFPAAAFDLPDEVCAGETLAVPFTGFAPPGTDFNWQIAPAQIVSTQPLRLVFPHPGVFAVSLTLNHAGCTDGPTTDTIVVKPVPTASFAAMPPAACAGRPVRFVFNGNAGPNAVLTWNFDGQIAVASANDEPNLTWHAEGPKIVSLSVEDQGCVSTIFRDTVWVYERLAEIVPEAALICLGDSTTLTAQIVGNAPGVEHFWFLNDSLLVSAPSITVAPDDDAQYVLFSRLNGECGYYDTARVRVNDVRPEAVFVFDRSWICVGESATVAFTGFAPEGSEFFWDWGPGGLHEPGGAGVWLATWSVPGEIPVRLYVVYDACSSEVYADTIQVRPTPFASFDGPSSVCVNDT
ncbi:MAG: hypothetical protein NZ534_09360, partial [Bacteroidia bacterium]|nr:hypothetical protein [Bacteroidia bacterium]